VVVSEMSNAIRLSSKPKCFLARKKKVSQNNSIEGSAEYAYRDCIEVSCPISGGNMPLRPRFAKFLEQVHTEN
jgi:hypothetical protein